jgi:LDH2 family malate/lactate/ureidoglycolate dehydrogenase
MAVPSNHGGYSIDPKDTVKVHFFKSDFRYDLKYIPKYSKNMSTETQGFVRATEVGIKALERVGVPTGLARTQIELLVEADLRGRRSHGLQRLPRIVERILNGVCNPTTTGASTWRGQSFLEVDGERGLGPVVAFAALDQICERARTTGVAIAGIRNNNHLGMLALYAEKVAAAGQTIIALTSSEALVHPWGGRKAMLGTNPIAIGVPATPLPFVLDMATSTVSMGQIHDYAHRSQPLEPGWALDELGDPTTDALAAKTGAIAPFGEAKGYALGLAFEVLVASLTACSLGDEVKGTLDSVNVCNKGDVFIVVHPSSSGLTSAISLYLEQIRACAPSDPAFPVMVPGDRAHARRERSMQAGIPITNEMWEQICALADEPR